MVGPFCRGIDTDIVSGLYSGRCVPCQWPDPTGCNRRTTSSSCETVSFEHSTDQGVHSMKCRLFGRHLAILLMCSTSMGFAQDAQPEKTKDDELATRRHELMQKRVASAQVSSREE